MNQSGRRGMVFGVFDGLHAGHEHFLKDALSRSDTLTVVVAPDEAVIALKGRTPRTTLEARMQALALFDTRLSVVAGDTVPGSWNILETYAPDIVFLGYDQEALKQELDARGIAHETLLPHEPERFKSSLLNGGR